jgi:acetolactate synthase-1/2/3 large subunit
VDEGITSGRAYWGASRGCPPHTLLAITGGSIGWGLPCATGSALACPERPVILLEADGSALYTFQALWTQAREGLNVTTILCANRSYRILRLELQRAGITEPGRAACDLTDLSRPAIDWVQLAAGLGVPGTRVDTAETLAREVARAAASPGPCLIEAVMA